MTLARALRAAHGGAPFLICAERRWTYAEVDEASDRLAGGLRALGIERGDRVAIAAPNCAEWVLTWLGTMKLGAVLVPLNVVYREREFVQMLGESEAVALICTPEHAGFDFMAFLDGLEGRLPSGRHRVFLDSPEWDALLGADPLPADEADPGDPAVILYTSGTTGEPKGATLTHASILASARAQAERLDQGPDDVLIGHMPLNHVGGMTCTIMASVVAGGSVALLPGYHPQVALDTLAGAGVTVFVGVPTMYQMMMGLPGFADADTSAIRLCIIGGSNVEPALARRILDAFDGARLANLYGLSETSGGCIISGTEDDLDTVADTLGTAIGDFALRVDDGELQVRGTCNAKGYWKRPRESAAAFDEAWLATGDMATIDDTGHVRLHGRKKEMYVRGGYNVYPAEIENVLAADETVAMCAVIGVPHERFGETGCAYVIAAAGHEVDPGALRERCRHQLADYKVPDEIRVVAELPLTPAGKIKKVAVREAHRPTSAPTGRL